VSGAVTSMKDGDAPRTPNVHDREVPGILPYSEAVWRSCSVSTEEPIGRVLGVEDATPLEFWLAVTPGVVLQLDEVVALERQLPGGPTVRLYGVVTDVRARYEGPRFASDVFLVEEGKLPAGMVEVARVSVTRVEPEVFVPPLPGTAVRRAREVERTVALSMPAVGLRLPVGLSRDGEPVAVDVEFLDGTRGAHLNVSGISGVATKTSYATFLLYSLLTSGVLGAGATNTKALVFNVKGEDLLFLDRPNARLPEEERRRYRTLGLAAGPFPSVEVFAPPRVGTVPVPDVSSRPTGVTAYAWSLAEFCEDGLLPYLFADVEDERQQYTMVVNSVTARLKREVKPAAGGSVVLNGQTIQTFDGLVDYVTDRVQDEATSYEWAGRAVGRGTVDAFVRRLWTARRAVGRLIRGDLADPNRHQVRLDRQVAVVDIHTLPDLAKRFVVGVVLRRALEEKERSGQARPLVFVLLDELNKYAPREGWSPIKELLLDVAERGRSLGVILLGCQQTASEVERRVVANCSIRVVGRLDAAEASRDEYGFLQPPSLRQRATVLRPGTMVVSQPAVPVPLVVEFPFPAWATRPSEAVLEPMGPADPFEGLPEG
jgi:DNA helicase HerA-like ATPase